MALLRRRVLRAASEAAAVRRSVKCGNDEQSQTSVGERQRANTDLAHSTFSTCHKPRQSPVLAIGGYKENKIIKVRYITLL